MCLMTCITVYIYAQAGGVSMTSAQVGADVRASGSCIILSALTAVSSSVLTLGDA